MDIGQRNREWWRRANCVNINVVNGRVISSKGGGGDCRGKEIPLVGGVNDVEGGSV
jgi:hypothetical protein